MRSWLACNHLFPVILLLSCLLIIPAAADVAGLDIAPSSIVITSVSNLNSSTGITVLNLAENPQNLTFSYVRPTASDTIKVLELQYVSFPEQPVMLQPQQSTDIPINVSTGSLAAGEYQGTLRILANNSLSSIPLDVKVRDTVWPAPVVFLGVSVFLSALVFYYGPSWRKRTTLRRNSALIRQKVITDQYLDKNEFARYFRQKVINILNDADAKILMDDLTAAETALGDAVTSWNWWYLNRDIWISEIDNTVEVMHEISNKEAEFTKFSGTGTCLFFTELQQYYRTFWRTCINPTSDNTLNFDQLTNLYQYVVRIGTILGYLQQARDFCYTLGDKEKAACCGELKVYAAGFREKKLDELNAENVRRSLEGLMAHYKPPQQLREVTPSPERMAEVRGPGTVKLKGPAEEVDTLTLLLNITELLTTMFLIPIILTLIGLWILYYQNPTFGSFFDYLSLVIWGFLSCASNEGIWAKTFSLNPLATNR